MTDKQPYDFVIHMSVYGVKLGSLFGFVTGIVLAWVGLSSLLLNLEIWAILLGCGIGSLIGLFTGLFLGAFAGFISGFFMLWVTQTYYQKIHNPQMYKFAMGFVTVISTTVFLIWMIFDEIGLAVFLMALGFAIHASQRVAHDYLHETDVRKSKAKAT